MDETRRERLSSRVIHELSGLLHAGEIKDPRVSTLVSFTYCKLAKDGSTAQIGVSSILEGDKLQLAVEGLNSAAGFLQGHLGKILRTRVTPRLYFVADHSIEEAHRVIRRMNELHIGEDA